MSTPAFRFDGTNPHAQRVAERQAAALVSNISEQTRLALRALITRSIQEGIPPYSAARMIEGLVGLNPKQAQDAMSYRIGLINSGLRLDIAERDAEKYAKKLVRRRAEAIARNEIMDALNAGSLESWRQAREEGLLGDGATKTAITTPDKRRCAACEAVEGQTVPLSKPFQTMNGEFMMPPFHLGGCRCTAAVNP